MSKMTSSPLRGLLLGLVVTAVIQSSSATTVMVVGFVNSGLMNLYQAVALACSEEARGAGVLAVFSDTIYSGRDIRKSNSYKTDAFEIGHFGSLGYMRDDQVCFLSRSRRPRTCSSPFSSMEITHLPRVSIAYWHCGADIGILDHMCEHSDGVVLAGSGSGNYGSAWQKHLHELASRHFIVRASRVPQGIVFDSPIFDPQGDTIPAYTFSPHKARILLMLALLKTRDREEIRRLFAIC